MRRRFAAFVLAVCTSIGLYAVPVGATESASEGELEESASSEGASEGGAVFGDEEPDETQLPPQSVGRWQLAAGLGTGYGSWLLAFVVLASSYDTHGGVTRGSGGVALGMGIGGTLVVAPTLVNYVGNRRSPSRHHRGAYLGTLIGAAVVGAFTYGSYMSGMETLQGVTLAASPALMTAGSVAGYHIQASRRQATSAHESTTDLAPMPMVDTTNDDTTVGLGLRGRF